jgi:hypothetical protein
MPHFFFTLLMAALVSLALAFSENGAQRKSVYRAVYLFVACIVLTVVASWTMFLIHG